MRVDVFLAATGRAKSREAAKRLIEAGRVSIDGAAVAKASENVDETAEHRVTIAETDEFVSRGGLKLEAALDAFKIDVTGMRAADIGASTGGFTDCLLRRGASLVYAADSGHGQLDARLCRDERVVNIEGFNARKLCEGELGGIGTGLDIAVMDVSFISQTLILPSLATVIADGGVLVSLIKPQFEVGREAVGKNGIVKKWEARLAAVQKVMASAVSCRLCPKGFIVSPIKGGDGNEEYLAYFVKNAFCDPNETIELEGRVKTLIKEGIRKE